MVSIKPKYYVRFLFTFALLTQILSTTGLCSSESFSFVGWAIILTKRVVFGEILTEHIF